jgi:hypothetical protein
MDAFHRHIGSLSFPSLCIGSDDMQYRGMDVSHRQTSTVMFKTATEMKRETEIQIGRQKVEDTAQG